MKKECPIPKILLAVDGSEDSKRATYYTACLAQAFEDKVTKITIFFVVEVEYPRGIRELSQKERKRLLRQLEETKFEEANFILEEAEKILIDYGISKDKIEKKVVEGKPWEEIIREGREGGYSIVVLGKKGKSKIEEFIMGSVAKMVVDRAKGLAVLLVE